MQRQRAGHGAPPGGRTPVTRLGGRCGGSAGMSVYLRACTVSCVCSRVYTGVVHVCVLWVCSMLHVYSIYPMLGEPVSNLYCVSYVYATLCVCIFSVFILPVYAPVAQPPTGGWGRDQCTPHAPTSTPALLHSGFLPAFIYLGTRAATSLVGEGICGQPFSPPQRLPVPALKKAGNVPEPFSGPKKETGHWG